MKELLIIATVISTINSFANSNKCQEELEQIKNIYSQQERKIESFQIKDCSSITDGVGLIMGVNRNTNAPEVYDTNACAIIINLKNSKLQELVVFDTLNNFSLHRRVENSENENFSTSRFGDQDTGTILFIKSEGNKGKDEYGFLKNTTHITRVNYDLESDTMQLLKWKLGFFSNKYSHDYTVQCQ